MDELPELPGWTRGATFAEKSMVFTKLAGLTARAPDAVTVLVWLLLPGAVRIANELRHLHSDIDGLVAGQLWIEASRAHTLTTEKVAAAILATTRREVCAELGVGDLAQRRDQAWARRSAADLPEELAVPSSEPEREYEAEYDVLELLRAAWRDDVVVSFDVRLLWDLATTAHRLGAPARRGRLGLTTPAVVEEAARELRLSPRTLRRRGSEALDRLAEYAAAREDPQILARWKREHPVVPLTAREELELVIREEVWWRLVTEEHVDPEAALDRVWTGPARRRRA